MPAREPSDIGRNLKFLRGFRHLSQEALAEKSQVSRATIAHLETGLQRSASIATLAALATALEVGIEDLLMTPIDAAADLALVEPAVRDYLASPWKDQQQPTDLEVARAAAHLAAILDREDPTKKPTAKNVFFLIEFFRSFAEKFIEGFTDPPVKHREELERALGRPLVKAPETQPEIERFRRLFGRYLRPSRWRELTGESEGQADSPEPTSGGSAKGEREAPDDAAD